MEDFISRSILIHYHYLYIYAIFIILNKTCKVKKSIELKSQEPEQVTTEVLIQLHCTERLCYRPQLYTHTIFQLASCLIWDLGQNSDHSYYNLLVMLLRSWPLASLSTHNSLPHAEAELLIFSWLFLQYCALIISAIPVYFVTVPIFQRREVQYSENKKEIQESTA